MNRINSIVFFNLRKMEGGEVSGSSSVVQIDTKFFDVIYPFLYRVLNEKCEKFSIF